MRKISNLIFEGTYRLKYISLMYINKQILKQTTTKY